MNSFPGTVYSHTVPSHTYPAFYAQPIPVALPPANPGPESLNAGNCSLGVRQQPREALVTVKGKEKFRKPVDPPPIVQLELKGNPDPTNSFLQNPYIFVSVSLFKADRDEPVDNTPNDSLAGTLVSSLHRLKDIDNKDGAFFVFGDISVKIPGTFRLHFTMYEFQPAMNEFQFIQETTSNRFEVVLPKDFKGLEESTYLSRAFSDQGVRLRLRKEARGMMSNKRGYPTETESTPQATIAPSYEYQAPKKRREDFVDSPVTPASNAPLMMQTYAPPPSTIQHYQLQNPYPASYSRLPQPSPHQSFQYNPLSYAGTFEHIEGEGDGTGTVPWQGGRV